MLSLSVHLSGAIPFCPCLRQLPMQLLFFLALNGMTFSLWFPRFSPQLLCLQSKDEAEISCVQLPSKHLHSLPSTTKISSFSNFLVLPFLLQPLLACPSHPLLRACPPDLVHPNPPLTAARARAVVYDPYSSGRPVQVGTMYRSSPSHTGCVHCPAMPLRIWLMILFITVFLSAGSSTVCSKTEVREV